MTNTPEKRKVEGQIKPSNIQRKKNKNQPHDDPIAEELKKEFRLYYSLEELRNIDPETIPTRQDWSSGKFSRFLELQEKARNLSTANNVSKPIFRPHSFQDILCIPPKKWLINNIFGAGDIGMIYGAPGSGKTFVVIDLIMKLCTAKAWANRFAVMRPLNVAYCAGEGISGLPSRFAASAKYHVINNLYNFSFYKTIPQLYETSDSLEITIKKFVDEWKARQQAKEVEALDVLVIDTFHTATIGADENSAQDMGKVLQSCRLVIDELGCTVILVHHTNKGGTSERGSSALRGAMDFMIEIRKPDGGGNPVISCSKLKDGEEWKDQGFQLCSLPGSDSAHVVWNDEKDSENQYGKKLAKEKLLAEMQRYPDKTFTCKSLSEAIGMKANYTLKLLNELDREGKCMRELEDPNKKSSNRNPWFFFIQDPQAKKGVP